jgi:hypothetical protein
MGAADGMNVLVTGRGTSGSWQIRGVQLGEAIGAKVKPNASGIVGYDACVIVKRALPDLLHRVRAARVPVVWDIVDAWPQPLGNEWTRVQCMDWLRSMVSVIRPAALVAATKTMAEDCEELELPVLWLPHHARPGQKVNPIRERVQTVGYEGGVRYLGKWHAVLDEECAKRGWRFVTNPPRLADVDIVVALRDCSGYAAWRWKSNVKLANAHGAGTPIICQRAAGYTEMQTGREVWADSLEEVCAGLDALRDVGTRRLVQGDFLPNAFPIEAAAEKYKAWLESLWKS